MQYHSFPRLLISGINSQLRYWMLMMQRLLLISFNLYVNIRVYVCVFVYVCLYLCVCICIYIYIYIYIYTHTHIHIHINEKLKIEKLTNCFRWKYLGISYIGQILNQNTLQEYIIWRHLQHWKTSVDILLYLLFRFSFFWHLHFNLKHLNLNICYILWPELIVWPKCLSV